MQHLDNDMDDLFQRAAENYPLRIDESKWESVAARISGSSSPEQVSVPSTKKGNKKIVWLALLLLLFTSIGYLVFQNNNPSKYAVANGNTLGNKTAIINKLLIENISAKNIKQEKPLDVVTRQIKNSNSKKNLPVSESNALDKITGKSSKRYYSFKVATNASTAEEQENNIVVINDNNFINKKIKEETARESVKNFSTIKDETAKQNETSAADVQNDLKKNDAPGIKKNSKKQTATSSLNKKGFYTGLIAGPDFNKVESGTFAHTGFDVGLIFGYRTNSRWSFETGIIRGSKNYRSQGKDFNMDKIRLSMPVGMVINSLQSNSSVIEIPVKVKYDVVVKTHSNVFLAAGISSYIMTKEKNRYDVTLNGTNSKLERVYNKNNYDVPAVANISLGYEHSISNHLHIRVEPFLKIPLQGVGVGSLPVTSAGLQVGFINRFK